MAELSNKAVLKLLISIERHVAKQTEMLEAMALALVGQDKAVEAVMEMLGKEGEEERREDVVQRGQNHERRILEMLRDPPGGPDDVQELQKREDEGT